MIPKFLGDDVSGVGGGPKEILFADYRSPQEILLDAKDPQALAKAEWAAFESDYRYSLAHNRTTIIDTGSEMYELIRLAELGRLTQVPPNLYGPVNAKMRALIRLAYDGDSNVIFLHKMKEEWVNEPSFNPSKGKIENTSRKTGNYKRAGWNDMGYQVQVSIHAFREDLNGGGSNFFLKVLDCRHNPALNGYVLEGEQVNFPTLAQMVMPGTSLENWL